MLLDNMRTTPYESIKKKLFPVLPSSLMNHLPDKWEKIGAVVTIKLPDELKQHQEIIGKVYREVLRCTTVLNDRGGILGVYREPVVEVISGDSMTETIHTENGVRFKMDPQKIMFSSGNMAERKRMATISNSRETVVDLFAGIGYFTLPIAVYSNPKKIFACEINPIAYRYLCANAVLNHVTNIIEPLWGDNRKTAPKDCADRVILGYLQKSQLFLTVALECLRNQDGILHYHEVVPFESIPELPLKRIETAAKNYHRSVELLKVNKIKSYAPCIHHVVLDVRITE
jgi:tRNA wybutosine-synthesizing protein 2